MNMYSKNHGFLADQLTDRATVITKLQHRGWTGFDAEFVFKRQGLHIVIHACVAIGVHQFFGHDEQRNTFNAFRGIRRARKHQVHDVVGVIVVAISNENFRAKDFVRTIGLWFGASTHQCQIRTRLRFR